MDVEVYDRVRCCRETCEYADIDANVMVCRLPRGACVVQVTIECSHGGVCRYQSEEAGE